MIELYRKTRFTHSDFTYTGTTYTEYLFGSIGLSVNAEIWVQVNWGTIDTNLQYSTNGSIERLDGGIASFITDGFRVGDTFIISGTSLNNVTGTILSFSDDGTTMFTDATLVDETIVSSIEGDTTVTSMEFYPNLIGNNTEFNLLNLTDRETIPKYYADTISNDANNPTIMSIGTNSRGWVTPADVATIYRNGADSTATNQVFVINHTFNITPIFLANQLSNLRNGNPPAPSNYKDRDSLKYVFTVDGKFTALDPDVAHTTDGNVDFPKGQVGWFNEFINGRATQWTKSSISYSDNATGAELSSIDYCKLVDVHAVLQSQVAVGTTYIVQVMYLPTSEDEYINTATDFKTNFIYEKAVVVASGGTVQGENTGDYHYIKNVTAFTGFIGEDFGSSNQVQIDFQIDFSQFLIDKFDCLDSDNLNYLIFITAQNGSASP